MEWNRGTGQTTQPTAQPANHTGAAGKVKKSLMSLRVASVGLLFCVTILIVALVGFIAFGGPATPSKYVDKSKMQAVFLNGGQVYFGKINNLSDKFMRVSDIYYLRVNQQVQPDGSAGSNSDQQISLVKLGCELHGPQDSMVINQDQVIFWENLKDDGQVAKAVAEYKKSNPDGQKCDASTNSNTSTDNSSNSSNSTNSNTSTNGTSSTTKKP
jgi:hypothetical protein